MSRRPKMQRQKSLRRSIGLSLALIAVVVMTAYAIIGPTGLYAYSDYSRSIAEKKMRLAALKEREAKLQNRIDLVDPDNADPDIVEELVRKELGAIHPDEIIME